MLPCLFFITLTQFAQMSSYYGACYFSSFIAEYRFIVQKAKIFIARSTDGVPNIVELVERFSCPDVTKTSFCFKKKRPPPLSCKDYSMETDYFPGFFGAFHLLYRRFTYSLCYADYPLPNTAFV